MTDDDIAFHATWRPASGHPSGWRVCRHFYPPHPKASACGMEEACGPSGRVRFFKSREAAQKAADKLRGLEVA
jgi:hypothetical protein